MCMPHFSLKTGMLCSVTKQHAGTHEQAARTCCASRRLLLCSTCSMRESLARREALSASTCHKINQSNR